MTGKPDTTKLESSPAAKKPYRAPQLKHLGSVRELTLGTSPGTGEVGTGKLPMKG